MSAIPGVQVGTSVCSASTLHRALGLVVTLTLSAGAAAQTDPAGADALFETGKAKLQAGDWPGACADFQASFALDPAVSTSIKLARCRQHEEKLASALAEYRRALELNSTVKQTPQRRKELEDLIRADLAELETRVPKLVFRITPKAPGLEVRVDGELVPEPSLDGALPVDPGDHRIAVSAPGYEAALLEAHAREAMTHEIVLTLARTPETHVPPVPGAPSVSDPAKAPAAQPASFAPQTGTGEPADKRGTGQRTAGLIFGGAGVVALGVAGYFAVETLLLVNDASSHCPDGACDETGYGLMNDATQAQTLGFVFGGIGAALLGTGIVLHVTATPRAGRAEAPPRTLVARLSGRAVSLEGSF